MAYTMENKLEKEDAAASGMRVPGWLKNFRPTDAGMRVLPKWTKGVSCVITNGDVIHGDFGNGDIKLLANTELYLPALRLKFASKESDMEIEAQIDPDSTEAFDVHTITHYSEEATLLKAKLARTSAALANPDAAAPNAETFLRVRCKFKDKLSYHSMTDIETPDPGVIYVEDEAVQLNVVHKSTHLPFGSVAETALDFLEYAAAAKQTTDVWIAIQGPVIRHVENWRKAIEARSLGRGRPSNAWAYTQSPRCDPTSIDKFRDYLDSLQHPPIPPFLQISSNPAEWHKTAQWFTPAYPSVWYPSTESFLNTHLPGILHEQYCQSILLGQIYNFDTTHSASITKLRDQSLLVKVFVHNGTTSSWDAMPRPGTQVECYIDSDAERTPGSGLTGYVQSIGFKGDEFVFVAPPRSAGHEMGDGTHWVVIKLLHTDKELRQGYDACLQAVSTPMAHEESGWFSIKSLMLGRTRQASHSLYVGWQESHTSQSGAGRILEDIMSVRKNLDVHQRKAFDTVIFGRPSNNCVFLKGGPGSGKTTTLCKITHALTILDVRTLIVTKEEETSDCIAAIMVRETGSRTLVRRFYTEGIARAYATKRDFEWKPINKPQSDTELAWSVGARATDNTQQAMSISCSVYQCMELLETGFKPEVVLFDNAMLLTDPELCIPLTAAQQSIKSVIIAGGVGQPRDTFVSEGTNPFLAQLSFSPLDRLPSGDKDLTLFRFSTNYRQHKDLAEFPNTLLTIDDRMILRQPPSGSNTNRLLGILANGALGFSSVSKGQREYFLNVPTFSSSQEFRHSVTNDGAVQATTRIIKKLVYTFGLDPGDMAVISLYSLDCRQLISSLRNHGLGQVEVSTTRRFMGRSKPIIFAHVPQAVPHRFIKEDANPFGFLADKKLLLLNTSCAQSFCIYVGYWELLEEYLRNPVVQRMNRKYSWISAWLLHMRQKNRLVQYAA